MFAAELFDIPTVYLMTGFSSAVAAGILLWLRKDHRDSGPALHYFAAAVLAMGSGFTTFAYRETIPAMLGPPVGYALYGLATIMLWLGSAQMLGRPVRAKPAWAAFAVYVPCMLLLNSATAQHAQLRIALGSGFIVFFLALAAREAHRSPWRDLLRSVRLMRAEALLQSDSREEAYDEARLAAELAPDSVRAQTLLGLAGWRYNRFGTAQQAMQRAIVLSGRSPRLLIDYAWFMASERVKATPAPLVDA